MMGLEEHLLGMFRDDFEFHDAAGSSHLGHGQAARPSAGLSEPARAEPPVAAQPAVVPQADGALALAVKPIVPGWAAEAELELKKIPFFVRGKARRNTEKYAGERGISPITVETLYDAKAHFGR
jgi:light-independent protochlorophyllide reductase subunit B